MATAVGQWLLKVFSGPHRGAEIVLTEGEHLIGGGDECDIILEDPSLAPQHARILVQGDAVTATAIDNAKIYLDGNQVGDARLQPYQYLTVGSTHLSVGPEGEDWPSRELPTITASESQQSELSESDSSESENKQPEETPADSENQPKSETASRTETREEKQRSGGTVRWIVSLLVLLLLIAGGIVVLASTGFFDTETPEVTKASQEDLEKVVREIAPDSTVQISERDEMFSAAGYVMADDTARELEDALIAADPAIDIADIVNMEDITSGVQGLLNVRRLQQLKVAAKKPGEIVVSGLVDDLSDWEKAKNEIARRSPVTLDDRVKDREGKSVVPTPEVEDPQPKELNSPVPPVTEPETAAVQESQSDDPVRVPLTVRDVTIGRTKFLTTSTGADVREGSIVAGGFTVKTIASDHVILSKDGEDFVVEFEVKP